MIRFLTSLLFILIGFLGFYVTTQTNNPMTIQHAQIIGSVWFVGGIVLLYRGE